VRGRVLAVWLITCLIGSTVWLFITLGVRDVPPVRFAVFRLPVALAVLLPIAIAGRTPFPRSARDWRLIAGSGVILLGLNDAPSVSCVRTCCSATRR